MKTKRVFVFLFALLGVVGHSQGQERILKGADLNVENLVDALSPESKDADEMRTPIRTRGLKWTGDHQTGKTSEARSKATVKKASASLLITFETNSAKITDETKASLDVVANALKSDKLDGVNFSIEGHADPRGNFSDNLRLSQERAASVVNYLVERHHIDASRVTPVGKGSTEPLNTDKPDAPENRRVTIRTIKP